MRARTVYIALVSLVASSACEGPTPTEPAAPDLQTVRASAPTANNGNGAQFEPFFGPGQGVQLVDAAGNYCAITFSDQQGAQASNDFYRYGTDGSVSLHVVDPAASMDLVVDGHYYQGVGQAELIDTSGTAHDHEVVNATGKVTDPGGAIHGARCSALVRKGEISQVVVRVN